MNFRNTHSSPYYWTKCETGYLCDAEFFFNIAMVAKLKFLKMEAIL